MTKRICLVVAYDGTDFCGWAPQNGQRTVHGTLTDRVRLFSGEENEIFGASRTDSGAHAKGQVCHFDTESSIPPQKWAEILNKGLPPDLHVVSSRQVHPEFHSRFWADKRYYRYRIECGERNPHKTRYTHYHGHPLDLKAMQIASQDLVGTYDFLAFSQELEEDANSVRTLFSVEVKESRSEVWIEVKGTAFVRGMMRRISGALLEIGRGNRDTSYIQSLFATRNKTKIDWPPVLPACGLTLMKINYGRHPTDKRQFRNRDEQDKNDE